MFLSFPTRFRVHTYTKHDTLALPVYQCIDIHWITYVLVILETIFSHRLCIQHCLCFPLPPNLGLSLQAVHFPHSFVRHPLQIPHLCFRCLLSAIIMNVYIYVKACRLCCMHNYPYLVPAACLDYNYHLTI